MIIARAGVPGVEWIRRHMELSVFAEVRCSAARLLCALASQHSELLGFMVSLCATSDVPPVSSHFLH